MPQTEFSDNLHAMKYRSPNEDFREAMNRVAFSLADNGNHYHEFREILLAQRFCPGGRIQGAAGATRKTTHYNCFVSGTINDSLVEGEGSIMDRLKEAAATSKLGGGIGYDFSTIRPKGDWVKTIDTDATGPISFMEFFNTVGLGVASSGHRRGAQMAVLRVDHPDIEYFIRAKQKKGSLEGFNISVGITDEFMNALAGDHLFTLKFGGKSYKEIRARDLWGKIMRSTWDWAEPGVIFLDTVNRMNPLWYAEIIAASNPCQEQPLPPFGACLLGSFNLVKYLDKQLLGYSFNYDLLKSDIPLIVRSMDNVVDRSRYPLTQQREEALSKRRMGLGVMGLANTGEALGYAYGSAEFLEFEAKVLEVIRDECFRSSVELAKEKGPFKLFDRDKYLAGPFIKALPEDIKQNISHYGIRNSHLTSIAPTGTISMCADNVSSGIEPVIFHEARRTIQTPDGPIETVIKDYGVQFLDITGKTSEQVTADEHVDVLLTAQKYVDSSISKTINMDGKTMPWEDFENIYIKVYEGGGKGCTTFNKSGLRAALIVESVAPSCEIDEHGNKSCE